MNKNLVIKDSLYYDDMMYELERIAGFDVDGDYDLWERLAKRKKILRLCDILYADTLQNYGLSSFEEELREIVEWIFNQTDNTFDTFSDISDHPTIVLEALAKLEKKKLDNEMLIQLMCVVKDMGLEDRFSLGQSTEQCVCLDKNDNSWEVYIVERETSFEKSVYEDCFDACVGVINQLADSKQMYEEAKEKFGMVRNLVPNK